MIRRRIVLVSPYALSAYGGVQEQILSMSRELCARDYSVVIFAPDAHDDAVYDTPALLRRFGRRTSWPANGSVAPLTLSPLAARRAWCELVEYEPGVVHFHEPFAPLLGWSVLHRHAFAAVGTFHRGGGGPAIRLSRPLLRRLDRGIDVAVAVSQTAADTLRQASGRHAEVLFNGFETERFLSSPRVRTSETTLLYVGRLESRKGVRYAIDAVRQHNLRRRDQWTLVVAGDGPERTRLEARCRGDARIVFLGLVDDLTKRQLLRNAHALIAPSTGAESFGLILLEAMASETNVVASDIEGYREAGASCATFFQRGDVDSLETAVERALVSENDERIRVARAHAERWSMHALVDEYEMRYDDAFRRFELRR